MSEGDFKITIKKVAIGILICLAIITPAHADLLDFLNMGTPVFTDEALEFKNSSEYLKKQWKVSNFTRTETSTEFWITNFRAPELSLSDLTVKNHDTGETLIFNYTTKTTILGNETDSIWNLFGILNPDSKLVEGEMCQVRVEGDVENLDIIIGTTTKTHWGGNK